MSSRIFYFEISQPSRFNRYTYHFSPVIREFPPSSNEIELPFRRCPARTIATCWELLFGTFCSVIVSAYTLRLQERSRTVHVRKSFLS